ncbi:MAG: GNAT family N-acetyltransferase [Actinomycetota bacterium]|nr:GNAT family N-acetyltransferase [Actinomycetota bacterium]
MTWTARTWTGTCGGSQTCWPPSRTEWGDAETPWSFAELRSAAGTRANWDYRLLLAWVEAEVVGGLWLRMPIRDNRHLVNAEVTVAPGWRRRGVGRALLTELDRQVEALGRSTIVVAAHRAGTDAANRADPLNEPPDPRTATLAERFGYTRAQVERRSSLTVPLDRQRRIAAETEVNRYLDGYRLLTWVNEIPPEQLPVRARLSEAMSVDVPLGELQLGPQAWDAARIANVVDEAAEQGRTFVETAAQDEATGALVAFTDLVVPAHGNGNAYQWDTFVDARTEGVALGWR